MKDKRKITNIVLLTVIFIGVFFIIKFNVFDKVEDFIKKQAEQNKVISSNEQEQKELKYETFLDGNGNEIVIEMEKTIGEDEEGNKVEFWVDTVEPEIIYDYMYKGTIRKIEDNRIYFMVDKQSVNGSYFCEDVKDYQIVFDINTYDLESDPYAGYSFCDFLIFDYEDYYSAEELKFLIGKYLRVQNSSFRGNYKDKNLKILEFYLN